MRAYNIIYASDKEYKLYLTSCVYFSENLLIIYNLFISIGAF